MSPFWHFSDVADLTNDVGSWRVKRTRSRHRGNDANDPEQTCVCLLREIPLEGDRSIPLAGPRHHATVTPSKRSEAL